MAKRTVRLSDCSWIRKICRIPNETIVLEKNDSESTKTKFSIMMAENGIIKGPRSQII